MITEAKHLLNNTNQMMASKNDFFFNACVNLAVEELSILTGKRDATLDIKHIIGLLKLCQVMGLDCKNLYICDRTVTTREIIYTLSYMNKDVKFSVLTEVEGNIVHTGVLKDFYLTEGEGDTNDACEG